MLRSQPFLKFAAVGVGTLLSSPSSFVSLATLGKILPALLDYCFFHADRVQRRRARELCHMLAPRIAAWAKHRDQGLVRSACRHAEELLQTHGLTEEGFAALALNPNAAAKAILAKGAFSYDEQHEIVPLCEELITCFYTEILRQEAAQKLMPAFQRQTLENQQLMLEGQKTQEGKLDTLQKGMEQALIAQGRETEAGLPAPLPAFRHLFGRDAVLERLVGMILDGDRRPILLQGGPGVGKSALSIAALHDTRLVQHFGEHRLFIRMEVVTLGEQVLDAVGAALGERTSEDRAARALRRLAQAPCLLVLDNLETPWEAAGQGPATGEALAQLAAVPGLRLVASIRGSERPGAVAWRGPGEIAPLAAADARALFLAVAGEPHASDPDLDALLRVLDGLPLAIDLMARRMVDVAEIAEL